MNPKAVGEISLGIVLAHLLKMGKVVLLPFGDNQRYDLVIDEDGKFIRAQCKTGRLIDGAIEFNTCSSNWFRKTRRGYRGQIDIFLVYCPANEKVYRIPIEEVGDSIEMRLRLEPSRNHQLKRIRWAKDYEYRGEVS